VEIVEAKKKYIIINVLMRAWKTWSSCGRC